MERHSSAQFRGASATLVILLTLFSEGVSGLGTQNWEAVPQLPRVSTASRHVMRAAKLQSSLNKASSNKTMAAVTTFARYPQLGQLAGCRKTIDEDVFVPAETWRHSGPQWCTDDVCLVQAMLAKSPLIIIDQDIDVSGTLPLPEVNTKVTILGKCVGHYPCMIDGMGAGRIFVVGIGGQLTLRDLEVRGGYCNEGAAVLVTGVGSTKPSSSGKLLALNVLFYNNTANTGNGGAILAKAGGAVHVRSCVFDENEAAMGGAVYVGGSDDSDPMQAGCSLSSCVTIVNSAFIANWADYGGAVYVDDATLDCAQMGGGKFECTTCSFSENYAVDCGGALFLAWKTTGAIGHVKYSRFMNNTAQAPGGGSAVQIQGGRPWTSGVEFISYKNKYFQNMDNEVGIAVKSHANATFIHDWFLSRNEVACAAMGDCHFCPDQMAAWAPMMMSRHVPAPAPAPYSDMMCPAAPPPLCEWQPPECEPWKAPMLPPPTPAPAPAPVPMVPPPPLVIIKPTPPPAPAPAPVPMVPPPPFVIIKPTPPPAAVAQDAPMAPPPPPTFLAPAPAPAMMPCICNCSAPTGVAYGDPHFYGKHGEHFDFHGRSGRDYCVVTDKEFHINMHLFQGLQRHTTFMSMLGVLYKDDQILINAQAHTNASRLAAQWAVTLNNVELAKGTYRNPTNGLNITTRSREVQIVAPGAMDLMISIIPKTFGAHGSGANYLNLKIVYLDATPRVHGLLGQSYQETKDTYKKLHDSHQVGPKRAWSTLLDGTEDDYLTTSILAPDCKFSIFEDGSSIAAKVHKVLVRSAHGLLPFLAHEKHVAGGCTAVGDHSICQEEKEHMG